jgi:cyclohexa-1,5-dienecarbonyl-CoA hydratase
MNLAPTGNPAAVRTTHSHGGTWLHVQFAHPKGNIITDAIVRSLRAVIADVPASGGLRLLTLEGAGVNFSFGASVDEHRPGAIDQVLPEMHALIFDLLAAPVPTGAIVRGRCLGGGFEIALACDLLFASEDAVLGLPEIGLGVFPPAGAAILPLRVGHSRAATAVLTGQPRPAAAWQAAGLIEIVAPLAALPAKVESWFETQLLPKSATALSYAARAARESLRRQVADVLPVLERRYLDELMRTADAIEGIEAFLEKRTPAWGTPAG